MNHLSISQAGMVHEYSWKFELSCDLHDAQLPSVASEIHAIFKDGFAADGWSQDGIMATLRRSSAIGLPEDSTGTAYGYAFYIVPESDLLGRAPLWEDAICLRRRLQGGSFSRKALESTKLVFSKDREIGWIGGRTQNPIVMHRYSRLGFLYPFDSLYSDNQGPHIIDFLRNHIAEVRDVKSFEVATGICKNVYCQGALGRYSWKVSGPFEQALLEWGFDRAASDAAVLTSKILN